MGNLGPFASQSPSSTIPTAKWLEALWAASAACGTYFCMYMFRKPFTAASFQHVTILGLGYKPLLVISQVLGYTISKFIGVRLVAEATHATRIRLLLILIGTAELALVGFGVTPFPYNLACLFVNGLPLGIVFGLVLCFLEGRQQTEALAAGLCASFVFADGAAKSVGTYLLHAGVPEPWMPATAGALFLPLFALFTWMLGRIPNPTAQDIAERSSREPMSLNDRRNFFARFAAGLIPLLIMYGVVGVLRGVRSDFAPELWSGLKATVGPDVFATSEMLAGGAVLIVFATLSTIRNNRQAFFTGSVLSAVGFGVVAAALLLQQSHAIAPFNFMVLYGVGLYLPYFAVHTTLFERLVACLRATSNIGYLMYLADAGSYAAYILVLLARTLAKPAPETFLSFFIALSWALILIGLVALLPGVVYFRKLGR